MSPSTRTARHRLYAETIFFYNVFRGSFRMARAQYIFICDTRDSARATRPFFILWAINHSLILILLVTAVCELQKKHHHNIAHPYIANTHPDALFSNSFDAITCTTIQRAHSTAGAAGKSFLHHDVPMCRKSGASHVKSLCATECARNYRIRRQELDARTPSLVCKINST